jgi:hypothetical protein
MKHKSANAPKDSSRAMRRHALFSLIVAVMIGIAGWQSPPASDAGSLTPAMYLPLIDNAIGAGAGATQTAEAQTATAAATAMPSATTTSTPTATATATSEPAHTVEVSGTVYLRPRYAQETVIHEPVAYVIVLDTSGSMNLNFDGEALDGVSTLQCGPSSDPTRQAKYQQDHARCQQIDALWLPKSERRIMIVKAALMNFIDQLSADDTMQIVASSSAQVGAITAAWEPGTPAGRQNLKDAVLNAGKTNNDPDQTSGGTTSASGLNIASQLLPSLPPNAPNGQPYTSRVLFLTDGVANHFLNQNGNPAGFGWYNDGRDNPACASRWDIADAPECQVGLTNTNPQIERPISAMVTQSNGLKQTSTVYVLALAGVNPLGLSDVASQAVFPYYSEASTPAVVTLVLDEIVSSVTYSSCVPGGGTSWLNDIDGAHMVSDPAKRALLGLPADTSVYGYAYLYAQNGQTLQSVPVLKAALTGELSYTFTQVAAGTYTQQAFVAYQGDDQPTPIARAYNWILLPDLSHATSRTFTLVSQTPGTMPLDPLYLDLNGAVCGIS